MKSTIISNYNMMMRVAVFWVSEICLTFNHFIYMIIGSKNILSMKNKTKFYFYDKFEKESTCGLFGNLV